MRARGRLRRPRPTAERVYLLLSGVSWACFTMFATAATLYRIRVAGLGPLELVLVGTALELTVFLAEVPPASSRTPAAVAWVVRQVSPRVRATVLSAYGQGNALGEIAGGPGMGLIARRVALTAAFWASAAALAPAVAVYARAAAAPDDDPVQDDVGTRGSV